MGFEPGITENIVIGGTAQAALRVQNSRAEYMNCEQENHMGAARTLARDYLALFRAMLPCASCDLIEPLVSLCLTETARCRVMMMEAGRDAQPAHVVDMKGDERDDDC